MTGKRILRLVVIVTGLGVVAVLAMVLVYWGATRTVYSYDKPGRDFDRAINRLEREAKETDDDALWKQVNRYHTAVGHDAPWLEREWPEAPQTDRLELVMMALQTEWDTIIPVEHAIKIYADAGDNRRADRLRAMVREREAARWRWVADTTERILLTAEYQSEMHRIEALDRRVARAAEDAMRQMIEAALERAELAEAGTPWRGE